MSDQIPQELSTHQVHSFEQRFSGKILLREEIFLSEDLFQFLLQHKVFLPKPSIRKNIFGYKCIRCNNRKKSLFGTLPCVACDKNHIYCRKCIQMGRVISCEPLYLWNGKKPTYAKIPDPCSWEGELAPHQMKAAERIVQAIEEKEKELLIWGVCGAGKTEMLFPGITKALQAGKRICLATPRTDVVRELRPRLEEAFSSVTIQALYGGSQEKEGSAQFIVSTTHQLLRFYDTFDVMIIDEIDAFPYHMDPSLPYATSRASKEESTTVYLTATPRTKQKLRSRLQLLPHIFVPVRFHGHPLPIPKPKMCFHLKRSLAENKLPTPFFSWLETRENSKRQLLIFVPTIPLAVEMKKTLTRQLKAKSFLQKSQTIAYVHAEDADREEKIMKFRNKEIQIFITTTILERGVTFPSIDVAVIDAGHDVFDEAALVQIAGRVGRSLEDPSGEVIFFHDGKTNAMERAIQSIQSMNKRGGF